MNSKEKIIALENLREEYFSLLGYEKDFNERIEYAIKELKVDFEKVIK